MQVGVTGGIGAGKSTVCRIFAVLGIPVYDADSRAKQLMQTNTALSLEIQKTFGKESYVDGKLDRAYLARLVFPHPEKVQLLNRLVHPEVGKDYLKWALQRENKYPYIIKEAALLIESGSYLGLDFLVTVVAPEDLRIKRVLVRDPHRSEQQVKTIISQQLTDADRIKKSDHILHNDEQQSLVKQVLELHQLLVQ